MINTKQNTLHFVLKKSKERKKGRKEERETNETKSLDLGLVKTPKKTRGRSTCHLNSRISPYINVHNGDGFNHHHIEACAAVPRQGSSHNPPG